MSIKMLQKKTLCNKGFSLVEIMISFGIIVVLLLAGNTLINLTSQQKGNFESYGALFNLKNQLLNYLNNKQAMLNTVSSNATMLCLKDITNCTPGVDKDVDVFDSAPNLADSQAVTVFKQTPGNGFTPKGVTCSTYPSQECPFRYVVRWRPQCGTDASRCRAPNYLIKAKFRVASVYKGPPINPDFFSFEVSRNSAGEQTEDLCTSVGGTFDSVAKRCIVGLTKSCPPGTYFVGINSTNDKICVGVTSTIKCPLGSVLWKVDAGGTFYCRSGCYLTGLNCTYNLWTGATNCPGNVSWSAGLGIVATGATPGFGVSPDASVPPPPPPAPPPPGP